MSVVALSVIEKNRRGRGWVKGWLIMNLITNEENENDRVRC
jgi:hypothetical protein